jgi:hypothetical protein
MHGIGESAVRAVDGHLNRLAAPDFLTFCIILQNHQSSLLLGSPKTYSQPLEAFPSPLPPLLQNTRPEKRISLCHFLSPLLQELPRNRNALPPQTPYLDEKSTAKSSVFPSPFFARVHCPNCASTQLISVSSVIAQSIPYTEHNLGLSARLSAA